MIGLEAQCPHQALTLAGWVVLGLGEPIPSLGVARLLL
jgi:hypothetical protein